jgi:hypothetical protein
MDLELEDELTALDTPEANPVAERSEFQWEDKTYDETWRAWRRRRKAIARANRPKKPSQASLRNNAWKKAQKLGLATPPKHTTLRQATFAAGRAAGLEPVEAASIAGYSEKTSNWKALETSKSVQDFMRQVALFEGITPSKIAERLGEMLDAETQQEFCNKDGLVLGMVRPDNRTRLEAVKVSMTMFGLIPNHKTEIEINEKLDISILETKFGQLADDDILQRISDIRTGRMNRANADAILGAIDVTPQEEE